jgi:hypothetical protein
MFELPRGPFRNAYGRVQRELAEDMDVILLPRHILARVITAPGATLDGLHLSDAGHRMLAETVAALVEVRPARSLPSSTRKPAATGPAADAGGTAPVAE